MTAFSKHQHGTQFCWNGHRRLRHNVTASLGPLVVDAFAGAMEADGGEGLLVLLLTAHSTAILSIVLQRHRAGINVVVIENLRVPAQSELVYARRWERGRNAYIMIFQVSTGRSASLKLQSNFSSEMGSSVGSW